jgi:hypothetical protein
MTTIKTLDTDFAAAVMSRGARLEGWKKSTEGNKLYWQLSEVNPEWIDDYRLGKDGINRFSQNRRMLVNIAKTEIKQR